MELSEADERRTRNPAKRIGWCNINEKPLSKTAKMHNADTTPFRSHVSDENHVEDT
jgi:hypothetical protein